ncbi:hypothetical protein ADK52_18190 [Streptomyces sp. WM6372]|uniref:hypothetical protein n=1 Tax=Streptomyces sp. WM6372 TaxID=1415555 RepID=UPI0006AE935A|nr:hypothetical protein [Streptomyces sp. WM6372]KOU23398.1 hypothetical protein ADK52_18190 [Streptomyces sp. WM6372]
MRGNLPRLLATAAAPAGAAVFDALPLWVSAVLFTLPGVLAVLRPVQEPERTGADDHRGELRRRRARSVN